MTSDKTLEEYSKSKEVTSVTEHRSTCTGYGKKIHTHAKYNPSNAHTIEILDTLKQKLPAKSQRLRQYKEANERKQKTDYLLPTKNPTTIT
jgi:hypothetical protein